MSPQSLFLQGGEGIQPWDKEQMIDTLEIRREDQVSQPQAVKSQASPGPVPQDWLRLHCGRPDADSTASGDIIRVAHPPPDAALIPHMAPVPA